MKGIILAGGLGTRLHPLTTVVSKQLLPIYDKPMIYYPLTTLMLAGIREILLISTPTDLPRYEELLGDGSKWGISLSYSVQPRPEGLAQAFIVGADYLGDSSSALILGDNVFFGHGLSDMVSDAVSRLDGAAIFACRVGDPQRYGVIYFDDEERPVEIVEKPENPQSHWAVTGFYFYDNRVVDFAHSIKPSDRGELEITDLNNVYLREGSLSVNKFGRGIAWLDTGTPETLIEAAEFVKSVERSQGQKIACPEEIALRKGFIDREQFARLASELRRSSYGQYLSDLLAAD